MAQKSSVGEMGIISNLRVGETGVGEMGVGEMGVGKMGIPPFYTYTAEFRLQYFAVYYTHFFYQSRV